MIPKIIHYCWFGRGEKPKLALKCIESWHRFCPEYEIIEWNEDNFDISKYPYAEYCYMNKNYAFLSDFVRLKVLYENGGIYFDTDVELVREPDFLLEYDAFFGFESNEFVNTGLGFGAVKNHKVVKAMLDMYVRLEPDSNGVFPNVKCPELNTRALLALGLVLNGERQNVAGAEVLPIEYMNPYDDPTGKLNKTKNTFSIHWYSKSWMSRGTILRSKLTKPLHRIFGTDCFNWLKR